MTLWLDTGTIRSNCLTTDDENALSIREQFTTDDSPQVVLTVPAGVGVALDTDWFLSEFDGCEPSVTLETEPSGTMQLRETEWDGTEALFVPDGEFKITFETNQDGIGGLFEFAGEALA